MRPVVPPKSHRRRPWKYDKKLYMGRHVVERNFRNSKEFRRVFTRYDKLDETYNALITFAKIALSMRNYCQHALKPPNVANLPHFHKCLQCKDLTAILPF
jgi:hypothetical protein